MTDLFLGVLCALLGGLIAIVGIGLSVFGGYTLIVGSRGGWWTVSLAYALLGAGLGFVGIYCGRYGLRLVRGSSPKD